MQFVRFQELCRTWIPHKDSVSCSIKDSNTEPVAYKCSQGFHTETALFVPGTRTLRGACPPQRLPIHEVWLLRGVMTAELLLKDAGQRLLNPPVLWDSSSAVIMDSDIYHHLTYDTHTHTEETRECVQPLRPSAKLSRGGRGGMSKRSGAAGRGVQATLGEVCEKMRIGSYCHTPKHKLHGEPRPENEFLLSGCSRMKFISSCCS